MAWRLETAIVLSLLVATTLVEASPPPGADPNSEMGQWFQSLRQPGTGTSCCSLTDCRMVDYRAGPAGYEVLLPNATAGFKWVPIPTDKIIRVRNPTGRPVVCARPDLTILCFVAPDEA